MKLIYESDDIKELVRADAAERLDVTQEDLLVVSRGAYSTSFEVEVKQPEEKEKE